MASQGVPGMSPEQLYTRMAQGELVVALDVRTAAAVSYQPEQIPGTRWLSLAEVVEQTAILPRNATIVTYWTWPADASSARAAQWLQAEGFDSVFVLENGLDAWKQAGYPTVPVNLEQDSPATEERVSGDSPAISRATLTQTAAHADTFLPGLARSYLTDDSAPISKELTVLFVDIANSTATIVNQPPEVALDLVQRFMGVVTEIALEYCGDVKDYEGDGALLYFESVMEATQAALAIRQALARMPANGHPPLQARFSLNIGNIIIGVIGVALRRSVALIGPSINLASRLLKHIPPSGIIATQVVVERLQQEAPTLAHHFQLLDEQLELKGFEKEYVTAYHVPWGELQQQLEAFAQKTLPRIPLPMRETLQRTTADLVQAGVIEQGLQVGDTAPEFALPNVSGNTVTLADLLKRGPAVVTFYRGEGWPYCNLQLQVYQKHLPEIYALGASFVAISPQTPDHSFSTAQKNDLTFEVLSDVGNQVAHSYRLVFPPSEELKAVYTGFGLDLATYNGDTSNELPIPGTFIIGQDGKICLAYLDPDFTHRLEPCVVIESLRTVAQR